MATKCNIKFKCCTQNVALAMFCSSGAGGRIFVISW